MTLDAAGPGRRARPLRAGRPDNDGLAARDAQLEAAQAKLAVLAVLAVLAEQIEYLRRRLGKDSSTSSKPPSSDNPYTKKPTDRSLRSRSGRNPGKQPGTPSSTLR